jgi:hypothetical protein
MLSNQIVNQKITFQLLILLLVSSICYGQDISRKQPIWWFGLSGGVNKNYDRGTTQILNTDLTIPAAFHKGQGVRPYASILMEYRPNPLLGLQLNVAFDHRGSKFEEVIAPCNCLATLTSNLTYVVIEPSLRYAPFKSAFYVFMGPTFSFNIDKSFTYTQLNQEDVSADMSEINDNVFGFQLGTGLDIPVSKKNSQAQMTISPFVSFQSDVFQAPRKIENWSIYSVRGGIALKFGSIRN